jgi:hypothetical protein
MLQVKDRLCGHLAQICSWASENFDTEISVMFFQEHRHAADAYSTHAQ